MYKTKSDLPEKIRTACVALLNQRLADSIDLMLQAKQAHWNVKGPNFIALHKIFDEVATDGAEHMDLIAERIMQLGGAAEGTIRVASQRSELPAYPLAISSGADHVATLSTALAAFGARIRRAIDEADKLGDKTTADVFTEISRGVDEKLWFVEAHLG